MLQCYNRGCGQKYNEEENTESSCRHHPGRPFFHDAYKSWTCCSKKTVDFTEFLNIKGCTLSKHSNVKPSEPVKEEKKVDLHLYDNECIIEKRKVKEPLARPSLDTPMIKIKPIISDTVKNAIDALIPKIEKSSLKQDSEIPFGTACKHKGCSEKYSTQKRYTECQYHPGVPIFHEGMKYWSCCNKKTSDFSVFLNQRGCIYGNHDWTGNTDDKIVDCRYDWHQTGSNVIVTVYAKMYHYDKSTVEVNPIRLKIKLVFPEQNNAEFNLDLELRGIIEVEKTTVQMYGTKIEIKMFKAEAGSWTLLDFPKSKRTIQASETEKEEQADSSNNKNDDSDVDLDDLNLVMKPKIEDLS